jgi:hypothetical protein
MIFTTTKTTVLLAGLAAIAYALPNPSPAASSMATVAVKPGDDTGRITAGQIIPVGPAKPNKRAAPRSVESREGEVEVVEAVAEIVKSVIDIFEDLEDGIKQDNIVGASGIKKKKYIRTHDFCTRIAAHSRRVWSVTCPPNSLIGTMLSATPLILPSGMEWRGLTGRSNSGTDHSCDG